MDDARRQRLGRILERAQSLPPSANPAVREDLIQAECRDDPELAAEARSLLDAINRAGGFLQQPTVQNGPPDGATSDQSVQPREGPGTTIGRYKLLQQIGEGGFGVVFMAEQREPVHRRVALKIIKLGMDTRQVVARFEAERQALAIMDHPNIAKVHDAGATETGRPFFVMELVRGDPITAYCDSGVLTIDDRLALFIQVCLAVQHAHQKGVIHRDLKPSNVLVSTQDGRPLVKVIDFGIAKATHSRLTEKTLFTEHRQLIGTPAYMSPEQADGSLDIDTRTDVYSLGVLLYELLTGSTPFDEKALRSAAFGEIQRIIREEEPPRPSTRISQSAATLPNIAARRHVEPERLGTLVRGDLDWIVMKALEKDRSRRYDTAAGLASDIERHLHGDPVVAAPPGAAYRARKFIRRHRFGVTAGAAVLAALFLGLVATGYGLYRAVNAERLAVDRFHQAETARAEAVAAQAQTEKARAEAVDAKDKAERFNKVATAVTEFFTKDLLDLHPVPEGGKEITVRELLDAVPGKIDQYFKSEPAVEGIIRERVGQLYRRIGEIERSKAYLVDAIPLLEKGLGPDSKQTLSSIHRLGELNMDLQRYAEAADLFDKAYKGRLAAYGVEYSMTHSSLTRRGSARVSAGRTEEGLADLREVQKFSESKDGRDSRYFILASMDLCEALNHLRRFDESLTLGREALASILRKGGVIAGLEWPVRFGIAKALEGLARNDEALEEINRVLAILAEIYPANHPTLIEPRFARCGILTNLNRFPEAAADLESTYDLAVATYGRASPLAHQIAAARAAIADKAGDSAAAATWHGRAK